MERFNELLTEYLGAVVVQAALQGKSRPTSDSSIYGGAGIPLFYGEVKDEVRPMAM